jgi:hypothetical protein
MKIDYQTARMRTHRRNIQRYGRLLTTSLTDLERQYLHRRIAEEQAELERLAQAEHSGQQDHRGASASFCFLQTTFQGLDPLPPLPSMICRWRPFFSESSDST